MMRIIIPLPYHDNKRKTSSIAILLGITFWLCICPTPCYGRLASDVKGSDTFDILKFFEELVEQDSTVIDNSYSYSYGFDTPTIEPTIECDMENIIEGPGGRSVKIKGKSGKLTFGEGCNPDKDPDKVTIFVDSIVEKDSNGNEVGTKRSPNRNKHQFNSLAKTDFTISNFEPGLFEGLCVETLNLTATFPFLSSSSTNSSSSLVLSVFFFCENGTVHLAPNTSFNESFDVMVGTLKFSVTLDNWPFCNGYGSDVDRLYFCKDQGTGQYGSFVDIGINIGGKRTPASLDCDENDFQCLKRQAKRDAISSEKQYDLGGNYTLLMSEVLLLDNQWSKMPSGFPNFTNGGDNRFIFTIRIPKYNDSAVYDPTIYSGATSLASSSSFDATTVSPTVEVTSKPSVLPTLSETEVILHTDETVVTPTSQASTTNAGIDSTNTVSSLADTTDIESTIIPTTADSFTFALTDEGATTADSSSTDGGTTTSSISGTDTDNSGEENLVVMKSSKGSRLDNAHLMFALMLNTFMYALCCSII